MLSFSKKINFRLLQILSLALLFCSFIILNSTVVQASTSREDYVKEVRTIELEDVKDIKNLERTINKVQDIVIMNIYEDDFKMEYTLLVPKEDFKSLRDNIKNLGVVTEDKSSKSIVYLEILGLQTTIKNEQQHKDLIMEMMKQAEDMETILSLENYMMEVEINLTSNQNKLFTSMNNINYVTLNINILKSEEIQSPEDEQSYLSKLGKAFKVSYQQTVKFMQNTIISLSYYIVPLLFFGIVILVTYKLIRKRGEKYEK